MLKWMYKERYNKLEIYLWDRLRVAYIGGKIRKKMLKCTYWKKNRKLNT